MDEGSGANVGTDANALELQNVHGTITGLEDGELLRVPRSGYKHTGSCPRAALQIVVKDVFNGTITAASDAGASFLRYK